MYYILPPSSQVQENWAKRSCSKIPVILWYCPILWWDITHYLGCLGLSVQSRIQHRYDHGKKKLLGKGRVQNALLILLNVSATLDTEEGLLRHFNNSRRWVILQRFQSLLTLRPLTDTLESPLFKGSSFPAFHENPSCPHFSDMPVENLLQRHWETVSLAERNTLMEINHISVSSQMQQASWLKCQNTYTVLQAAFSTAQKTKFSSVKDYFCLRGQRWSEHSKIHKNAHLNFLSSVSAHYFFCPHSCI